MWGSEIPQHSSYPPEPESQPRISLSELIKKSVGFTFENRRLVLFLSGHWDKKLLSGCSEETQHIHGIHNSPETRVVIKNCGKWKFMDLARHSETPNGGPTTFYFLRSLSTLTKEDLPEIITSDKQLKLDRIRGQNVIVFNRKSNW